jgi:hypothetical protein
MTTQPAPNPIRATNGPIHTWVGLSYSNYQVLHRTLMQSMPPEWQQRMVACLKELRDAFEHIEQPEAYTVIPGTEHILNEMTDSQLYAAGIKATGDDENGPTAETRYHRVKDGAELDGSEHVLLPTADPVPHYNRGRTYIEPRLAPDADTTHIVADDSDDPEHVDDCPGCATA